MLNEALRGKQPTLLLTNVFSFLLFVLFISQLIYSLLTRGGRMRYIQLKMSRYREWYPK